jgi:hypothetical protein
MKIETRIISKKVKQNGLKKKLIYYCKVFNNMEIKVIYIIYLKI